MRDQNIVILTGAGISAESGLSTFRDNDGLWCNHRIEDVATPEAFRRNPALVHEFYNQRRAQLRDVKPNAAHIALANLAANWQGKVTIVTQNVDDLHERAHDLLPPPFRRRPGGVYNTGGASNNPHPPTPSGFGGHSPNLSPKGGKGYILHMHGELRKIRCDVTEKVVAWEDELYGATLCDCCKKPGRLRPHIVWFGEMPLYMDAIAHLLRECDLFMSVGTSGNVYPAAGFVHEVRSLARAHTVELNMEPSLGQSLFHEKIYGPATQTVPAFVERLFS